MPQGTNQSITVGSTTSVYALAQTQQANLPTLFVKAHSSGVIEFGDILSHQVTTGSKNRNVKLKLTQKVISSVDGIDMLARVLSCDVNFSFPKSCTATERTQLVDTLIAGLTKVKADIISTEIYF